ncbi:MAG: hypothetical protein FD174_3837 [Geobacteraceae bacterium]|nr:MAG: hypothetical protein FD174_3837 [Geobacteraceae bacterium]
MLRNHALILLIKKLFYWYAFLRVFAIIKKIIDSPLWKPCPELSAWGRSNKMGCDMSEQNETNKRPTQRDIEAIYENAL